MAPNHATGAHRSHPIMAPELRGVVEQVDKSIDLYASWRTSHVYPLFVFISPFRIPRA